MRNSFAAALACVALAPSFAASPAAAGSTRLAAAPAAPLTIVKKFTLGGDGGWDYLTYDPVAKHLFVSRATRVMVVDPASGSVVTEIPGTPGVHGIALAQDAGKGFTSNGRDNSLSVFDLKTLQVSGKVSIAGKNPDAIVYDPASKHVLTMNGGSNDATVVDAATNAVVATVALPGRPEFAVSGQNGFVYANIEDKNEIVAIDTAKNAVTNTWPLGTCDGPSGLAIDVAHLRLFSVCSNKLMTVVDATSGKVVATLAIGQGPDAAAFDPGAQLAYSSNGEGTLSVYHEDSPDAYTLVQTVTTEPRARTMTVDPNTHDALLVTAQVKEGPPAPGSQRPTRTVVPGTFEVIVVGKAAP